MTKLLEFGMVMSSFYAIPILTLLNQKPSYRVDLANAVMKRQNKDLCGIKTKRERNLVNYYIRKMTLVGLIEKERSAHTNEVLNFGRYKLTALGKKAYDMAVTILVELNLPKNKLLLTNAGKIRMLR